jgi:stearoyl-CoA desaturase (Delta-9 desaturase)
VELLVLDRFDTLVPVLLAVALYTVGATFEHMAPQMGTSGG